jgi:hypothetical protein
MASIDFPENERDEGEAQPMADEQPTPAERAADSQPSIQDYSTDDMWDTNRKVIVDSEFFDNRVMNLNQKVVGDVQAQQMFEIAKQERVLALKLASQELLERQQAFKERQDQHSLIIQRDQQAVQHQADLNALGIARLSNSVSNDAEIAMKHNILSARTVEPKETLDTISETVSDAAAKGAQIGARAMADSGQTSIGNLAGYSAVRQVADVNSINTMAAYQALSNQVAELTLAIQALQGKK